MVSLISKISSRSSEIRDDSYPRVSQIEKPAADCDAGIEIKAARRLRHNEQTRLGTKLPPKQKLLRVSAREFPGTDIETWRSDVEFGHELREAPPGFRPIDPKTIAVRGAAIVAQDEVIRQAEFRHETDAQPIFGHIADTSVHRFQGVGCGRVLPTTSMRPDSGFTKPVINSASSVWPLPATPAMPRISPLLTVKSRSRIPP